MGVVNAKVGVLRMCSYNSTVALLFIHVQSFVIHQGLLRGWVQYTLNTHPMHKPKYFRMDHSMNNDYHPD